MDRKDEIILKQYEIIRGLTERSLKSERSLGGVGSDFWGAPQMEQVEKKQRADAPAKPEPAPEEEKPETIDELKAELAGYIGLEGVKKEDSNLINMMTVWKMRKEHGLPPRKLENKASYELNGHTIPVLYALSPLVMPRPADWGANIHMTGYWLADNPQEYTPEPGLQQFLSEGGKPIYVGFGSMVSGNMNKTMTTVLRAVRASGVRAVIGMGWGGGMQNHANSRVYISNYIPHDWLFPRVAAVVHHGGAGTTASGLRNGKPTRVIPFGGDQPFWGNRVYALGCGPKPIPRDRLTVNRLVRGLIDLTSHASYQVAAEELAERMRLEGGVYRAADLGEQEIAAWKAAPDQP